MNRVQAPDSKTRRMVLPDGTRVKRYELRYLASGGMSVVYLGTQGDKQYVLKEVSADNSHEVLAITQEKGLLERLDHPGIVAFHELFEENGFYYLVLEYVNGKPLADIVQGDGTPSQQQVADWGAQLCDIMDYLHSQTPPIIYRDLKPENVMVADGKVKLIDFGIARLHKGEKERDTELMGSTHTASPEHYGGAETDARSDIYSLGATLYHLLSDGRTNNTRPFRFAPITHFNERVEPEFEKLLDKALSFEPENRFQTMQKFKAALLPFSGRPDTVPMVDEDESRRRTGGNTWKIMAALAFLALLMGGMAYFNRQQVEPPAPQPLHATESLFRAEQFEGRWLVTLGEDLPLFSTFDSGQVGAGQRAETIAERFNTLYNSHCSVCGDTKLSARDVLIGRYRYADSGQEDIVLFYAHIDNGQVMVAPIPLLTISRTEAEKLKTTPRILAGYWREMSRDVLRLSRGEPGEGSPLGKELREELGRLRGKLGDEPTLDNLQALLQQLGGQKLLKLRSTVLEVPDRFPTSPDNFSEITTDQGTYLSCKS